MNPLKYQLAIDVQEPYLSLIKSGRKTIEGRLGKAKYLSLKKGDLISINGIKATVNYVVKYQSFKEMLLGEGIENVIPDAKDLASAISAYYKFYSPSDEKKYQVAAISIKLKNEDKSRK